ncbi:SWIM zinc finger family protein [Dactylonectria estremocensis]|uniref:SWIM zinc finger family protein n=1 Tax=Dactylonectria estremocensis TaxID=1079267 RepID=A0A9P9JEY0_9HYPO|nr:SWIM zinc finger family protein [Dactylonectria estremocensis]
MSPPVSRFSKLTLESMPTGTPPKARAESRVKEEEKLPQQRHLDQELSSESESDSDSSEFEDESPTVIRSPSKLTYLIDHLPKSTQDAVRDAFTEPPRIALQKCRRIDNTYAFQMTELVTRSIRIRASKDGASQLSCSCGQRDEPCEHLLWLLDQVVKQTVYDQDTAQPLKMTNGGYPKEMGDPFQSIASHHLDLLADGIHCQVINPDSEYDNELDLYRTQEARELLASVYGVPPDEYRPDIFAHPSVGRRVFKRRDLDRTIFRMLLDDHHFFHYFHSLASPTDPINDPFRKLSQRVDHVLRDLDTYAAAASAPAAPQTPDPSRESPRDVRWAAGHITGAVRLIRHELYTRDRPLQPFESISAARSLVRILESVVARNRDSHAGAARRDRNLYLRLIGDCDEDFVLGVLALLPEAASQFLNDLEAVLAQIGVHGAPAPYAARFRALLDRLRTSSRGSGLKRSSVQGQGADRESKRMK